MMKMMKNIFLSLSAVILFMTGCAKVEEPDYREKEYGYVQFKLYKEASYPRAKAETTDPIPYLNEVAKMEVSLLYGETLFSQTLVMNASDDESAEFGLRSDKLKLLTGDYTLLSYRFYDKLDKPISTTNPSGWKSQFTVTAGGLCVHDLLADVQPRGKVRFTLIKDMDAFTESPATKAADRQYTFDEIKSITIQIRSNDGTPFTFEKLPAKFSLHLDEDDVISDKYGYTTSTISCDTLISLKAGKYKIEQYTVYDVNRMRIEVNTNVRETEFVIEDNLTTDVNVPVKLYETDEYLKDYYALYEIWKALNGEKWYYSGEEYPDGANWDFNKDPDLWGDQPGVSLHSNGRVALINISDFGFSGKIPAAIGQLTELTELYLGTHNDRNQNDFVDQDPTIVPGAGSRDRLERHKQYLAMKYPATPFSEPIARALKEHNISVRGIEMYDTMTEDQIIDSNSGAAKIQPKDVVHGKLYNGLTEIDPAIWRLNKLEKLNIANGKLKAFPERPDDILPQDGLKALTDLELYNCSYMEKFPEVVTTMPSLVSLNISNNKQWSSEDINNGLKLLADGNSGAKLQILYMNENRLTVVDGNDIAKMKSLGLLDLADNEIETVTPFGKDINIVQLYLDNNRITELKRGADGTFCGIADIETFSVRNNRLTEFPDIFDAESQFGMTSVDFSYNQITKFAGTDDEGHILPSGGYKGIYVETLNMTNNPITTYPLAFKETDSKIAYINMRGCLLEEVPDSSFTYDNAIYLTSLDLSYNHLDDLPYLMHSGSVPYLYGVDLSYNRFSKFPWEPFDSAYLTVFALRGQRNAEGQRCLSEWPEGIYQHVGLRGLYLGSNNFGKVNDTISTLCYYLDISDNPDIVFDASDICYAWQVGAYYLIYDKTQDIRNCDYMLQ